MQRTFLRFLIALVIITGCTLKASATHIIGADFYYEHLGGLTYQVTLVIYGDCAGSAFPNLQGATPVVSVKNGNSNYTTISLSQSGPGVEVTPVCSALKNNTACTNVGNPIPGVKRYIYTTTITLPYTSANWLFHFDGNMSGTGPGGGSSAGRSTQITNIGGGGSSIMALEAHLNNAAGANSSPQFTTLPTPFYCVNVPQQYNLGAYDVNGDSLTFALVPGMVGGGGVVSYVFPYSATNPLDVVTGTYSFSTTTGQLNFKPANAQISLVVQQVNEYRNGVLVGTAMREMNFVVLTNCNNTPASSSIDTSKSNTQSGVIASSADFYVCEGADSAKFNVIAKNPGNDTIIASVTGLPTGTSVSILNNNTTQPIVSVTWKNATAAPGTYTFYVTYKDNGCPLTSTQTQAYTVHIFKPNQLATTIAAPTQCVHKALVNYNFSYGLAPRTVIISQGGNVIRRFRDSTGYVQDSLATGSYSVAITSDSLTCPTYLALTIVDSGVYPYKPKVKPAYYCKYDQGLSLVATADSGAILHWYTANGGFLSGSPTPRTDTTGIFYWLVDQKYKVCTSQKDTAKVYVTLRPIASYTAPDKICLNDTAIYNFNGQIGVGPILEYSWDFAGAGYVAGDSAGPWHVHWYDTGRKIVQLTVAENKCSSFPFNDTVFVKAIPYAGFNVSNVCQFDTITVAFATTPQPNLSYLWNFGNADIGSATGPGPYRVYWTDSGTKQLSLTVSLDGCTDTRKRTVEVYPKPQANILTVPGQVCIGDEVSVAGGGGINYYWDPSDPQLHPASDPVYSFRILHPVTLLLQVQNEWSCRDTAGITWSTVNPCCQFSYPDAFTPNGDGRNDHFHIVTYGNALEFELSVYNRWGQRVYYGTDPKQGWDGMLGNKMCDAGTYFYYMHAKCYTGHEESRKGELELIR